VARSLSAAALDVTLTADIFVAVVTAVLGSAVLRSDVVLAMSATVHLADATLVEVVFLLRFGDRCGRWRLLSTNKRLVLVSDFFLLNKVVIWLIPSNDDLLRFATLFPDDQRLAAFLSYYDRSLRCWFSYDNGLRLWLWLLIVFSFPPVPLNLGLVMMVVVWMGWWIVPLALESVLADSVLRRWGGHTNSLSISFWVVEAAAGRRDLFALNHAVGNVTSRGLPLCHALGDVPFVVAALVVSAITLGDAEVNLSARLGWWWVLSALVLDDDLIVVDFVFLPWAIGDLVALDGGVWAARLWVSLGLVALAVDDALASHRHGGGVCLVGWDVEEWMRAEKRDRDVRGCVVVVAGVVMGEGWAGGVFRRAG
jgi:hypothetical protein